MAGQQLWKVKSLLPLMQAELIIDCALKTARSECMAPMTVAVLDTGGHLIALK